jgi:hypothetical protein
MATALTNATGFHHGLQRLPVSKLFPLSQYFKPNREIASKGLLIGACLFNYSLPARAD